MSINQAFNVITEASWQGMAFRRVCRENAQAMEALQTLARYVRHLTENDPSFVDEDLSLN